MSAPPIAIFAHDKKAETHADSRAWLKSRVSSPPLKSPTLLTHSPLTRKGTTQTMHKSTVYQNSLQAVPFPQYLTGYKDPLDFSHKRDKSAFISSYKTSYGPIDDKPVKFRDGMPIDARRITGKPLMDWGPHQEGSSSLQHDVKSVSQQASQDVVTAQP